MADLGVFSSVATVVAGVVGLIFVTPQLYRLMATRNPAGLSVTAQVNGCVSYAAWTAYFLLNGRPLVAMTVLAPGVLWAVTTVMLLTLERARRTSSRVRPPLASMVWLLTLVVGVVAGEPLFGVLLGTSSLWAYLPALVKIRTANDLEGVSAVTWGLTLLHSAAVVVAGWPLIGSVFYGAAGVLAAALILWTLHRRGGRHASTAAVAPREG
jgi:uncharacterized protein with PQ loop repeat